MLFTRQTSSVRPSFPVLSKFYVRLLSLVVQCLVDINLKLPWCHVHVGNLPQHKTTENRTTLFHLHLYQYKINCYNQCKHGQWSRVQEVGGKASSSHPSTHHFFGCFELLLLIQASNDSFILLYQVKVGGGLVHV